MKPSGWLLFLYALPSGHNRQRVQLWRKLKKLGAVSLKTSACLLPDAPEQYERLQWLMKQVNDEGGDATLVRAPGIEGMSEAQVVALFNDARAAEYSELIEEIQLLLKENGRRVADRFTPAIERIRARYAEIQLIDFFDCARGHDAASLLQKAERAPNGKTARQPELKKAEFSGKIWLTRPRPEIDRVASAWLIKTFIDRKARFVFSARVADYPKAIPYDMTDVAFTHQGEDCTFETLVKRFGLTGKAIAAVAEMVHDTDLGDGKFGAPGAAALHLMLKGLARTEWSDANILKHGFICFDALFAEIKAG